MYNEDSGISQPATPMSFVEPREATIVPVDSVLLRYQMGYLHPRRAVDPSPRMSSPGTVFQMIGDCSTSPSASEKAQPEDAWMMADEGSVDVVVVHHNRTDLTERCVRALAGDDGAVRTVTIVDSGSSPPLSDPYVSSWTDLLRGASRTSAAIELFVEVVESNVGFAEANNRGLALRFEEGAEFFLVLNNDAYVSPSALRRMVSVARETGAAMVVPAVYRADEPSQVDRFGLTLTKTGAAYDRRSESDGPLLCPSGCAALYRRDLVADLMGDAEGFFDRRFEAYAEDLDAGLRARARGYDVAFAPDARILHEGSATFGSSSPRANFLRHRNTLWAVAKNLSSGLLWRHGVWLGLGQVAALINGLRRRTFRSVVMGKFSGLRAWHQVRGSSEGRARISDVQLFDRRFWISR